MSFGKARDVIVDAIRRQAFPAAAIEVGTAREAIWREAFGRLTYDQRAAAAGVHTIFDLSSLTKVIATTSSVMQLVEAGRLRLDDTIADWIPEWRGDDRAMVTVEDCLLHAAGLPAWLPLYRTHAGRDAFRAAIAQTGLEYPPRTRSVYSDLGFMLLGLVVEAAGGATLDEQFSDLSSRLALGEIRYLPPAEWKPRTAPTEYDGWRGRLLVGEVHDENAAALGGVAGHSGLFGTAGAVGRFAQQVLGARLGENAGSIASPETVRRFTTRHDIPGSSRALGWDTMLPTSSCGTLMSPASFGHTGFTGTSLWIDPARGFYAVLLTNRVHPSRSNDLHKAVRPAFHDAVASEVDLQGI